MLKDQKLLSVLQRDGFVRFSFLNENEIEQCRKLFSQYDKLHTTKHGQAYHTTFHADNRDLSVLINQKVNTIIKSALDTHFQNYLSLGANFLIKECTAESELAPHQDWTFVDETKYQSANVWIPLQDVDTRNGCLTFLPKSHSILYSHRPSPFSPGIFDKVLPIAKQMMIPIPMKAGEAVVFSHSILHGSVANNSNKRRISLVQGLYSKDAQLQHLFIDKETNMISEYHITVEDFYKMEYLKRPLNIEPFRELIPEFPQLTEQQFLEHYPIPISHRVKQWLKTKFFSSNNG